MGQSQSNNNNNEEEENATNKFLESIPTKHRIKRVHKISAADFEKNYFNKEKPVIITGMMDDWPALTFKGWDPDSLKEKIGTREHTFRYGGNKIKMNIADYIDAAKKYIASDGAENDFPPLPCTVEKLPYVRHFGPLTPTQLGTDVHPEIFFTNPEEKCFRTFIFMGLPKTKTEIHYDDSSNLMAIAWGTKHITLLPPDGEQEMNICRKK